MKGQRPPVVTPIAWMEAPQWLTAQEAYRLSGWAGPTMPEIVVHGAVDVNAERLIEKENLRDCQECLALVLHWDDE